MITKYFYNGIPLAQYCRENNISYSKIELRISRHHLTVEEALNYKPKQYRYNLVGKKFNMLTVLEFVGHGRWKCKCNCGNYTVVDTYSLTHGATKSCGCYKPNKIRFCDSKRFISIYDKMIRRCYNKKDYKYKNYGGRGIFVCSSWREDFINFKNDMYESYINHVKQYGEKNTTIDRINVNGNYCKENCRWATLEEQAQNKQNTLYYNNEPLTKYCKEHNINYKSVMNRIYRDKMSVRDAVLKPFIKNRRIDISNMRFGKWTVQYYVGNSYWHCRCDCGFEKDILSSALRNGLTKGCLKCYRNKK